MSKWSASYSNSSALSNSTAKTWSGRKQKCAGKKLNTNRCWMSRNKVPDKRGNCKSWRCNGRKLAIKNGLRSRKPFRKENDDRSKTKNRRKLCLCRLKLILNRRLLRLMKLPSSWANKSSLNSSSLEASGMMASGAKNDRMQVSCSSNGRKNRRLKWKTMRRRRFIFGRSKSSEKDSLS